MATALTSAGTKIGVDVPVEVEADRMLMEDAMRRAPGGNSTQAPAILCPCGCGACLDDPDHPTVGHTLFILALARIDAHPLKGLMQPR